MSEEAGGPSQDVLQIISSSIVSCSTLKRYSTNCDMSVHSEHAASPASVIVTLVTWCEAGDVSTQFHCRDLR